MKIEFSQEEKNVANGLKMAAENAPIAVTKTALGVLKVGAGLSVGIVKTLWSAGSIVANSAAEAINSYQQAAIVKQPKQETIEVKAEVIS